MYSIAKVLFGASILLAANAATASSVEEVNSRRVSVADLDLSESAGRATLDRRIAAAARAVCQEEGNWPILTSKRTCVAAAIASANRQRDRLFAQRGIIADFRAAAR